MNSNIVYHFHFPITNMNFPYWRSHTEFTGENYSSDYIDDQNQAFWYSKGLDYKQQTVFLPLCHLLGLLSWASSCLLFAHGWLTSTSALQSWSRLCDVSNLWALPLPVSHWAMPSAQVPHVSKQNGTKYSLYPSPIGPSFILSPSVTSPSLLCAKTLLFSSSPPAALTVACTETKSLIDLVWIFYELQNEKCTHGERSDCI